MLVFLDTEFTDSVQIYIISIALVNASGFYFLLFRVKFP